MLRESQMACRVSNCDFLKKDALCTQHPFGGFSQGFGSTRTASETFHYRMVTMQTGIVHLTLLSMKVPTFFGSMHAEKRKLWPKGGAAHAGPRFAA